MKISILTLFPEMFEPLKHSIIKRATDRGVFELNIVDIREFSEDKHGKCDDEPFGGGVGMVMTPQPIYDAISSVDPDHSAWRVFMSPKGATFNVGIAKRLALGRDLVILCGHYEGVDQRVIDLCIDEEISIGDYILTGGELPAMVVVDCVSRFIPGTIKEESAQGDSFSEGLLEYPQYTRPRVFKGLEVPDVLLSGHHEKIDKWRRQKSLEFTAKLRADLLEDK
ncbi:MAG: tRNA (guanosine(37)-N1)-methyltransferase TrmD [Clostridiales bacterium]|nr:tRNA (guanosine(37)-N1)-methyltransferase TrmD [Clostridiales bacterium]